MKLVLVALSALALAGCGNTLAGAKTDLDKLIPKPAPAPVVPPAEVLKVYYPAPQLAK